LRFTCSTQNFVVFTTSLDRLAQPLHTFPLLPFALLFGALFEGKENADSMLNIILPRANILVSIRPDHGALASFKSLVEVSSVLAAVLESELTLAREDILLEVALVGLLRLCEVVDSVATKHTVFKVTFVVASILPLIATFS